MNKNKFYITTPIYYVNSKPHVGTLYSTLLADVAARWQKLMGKKVFFLTGTDEHGQKVAERAKQEGVDPQKFVDSMVPAFKKTWQKFDIEFDHFVRTTDDSHKQAVHTFLNTLIENDDIYLSEYSGLYCTPCETFITDAVKSDDGNYLCSSCQREVHEVSEESYFFRLSSYEQQLLKFYEENPHFIAPKERLNEVISFVKGGLKDLCISRKSVKWGIPFPGNPEHTVYVWGDALTNYISALGYGQDDQSKQDNYEFWWPADVHVMAKDIVRFHAVYWPAFLMAANLPMPKKLVVHGYVLLDDSKMSKSKGNVLDPDTLATEYGVDQIRYYLMRQMPIGQDGSFSFDTLREHINADLANNLGNLLNRTTSLALKNKLSSVKAPEQWSSESLILRDKLEEAYRMYWEEMNKGLYHIALSELWKFISEVNAFFHAQQPWILAKKDPALFADVIAAVCHSLHSVATMLWPVMPNKMIELLKAIGHEFVIGGDYDDVLRKNEWNKSFELTMTEKPLFTRIEKPEEHEHPEQKKKKEKASVESEIITIDDVAKVQLRVGTVVSCEPVAKSDKLLKLNVDLGKFGVRNIFAGVAKYFKPEDLLDKQVVVVANLKPRKMMGSESQGMMLLAVDKNNEQLVTVSGNVENGTLLR